MDFSVATLTWSIGLAISTYLTVLLIEWLINYVRNTIRYYNIKGYPVLPIIGNLHQMGTNGETFLKDSVRMTSKFKDEPFLRMYRAWSPIIIFHKAEHVDILFNSSKHNVKSFDYEFLKPWLAEGLLISNGEKWSARRKLITPTFHFDILNDFLQVMNENSETCVNNLNKLADTGKEIDIFKQIGLCALDIICETAMGENVNAQNESDSEYIKAVAGLNDIIRKRTMNPLKWNHFLYSFTAEGKRHQKYLNILHQFTRSIIIKRDNEFNLNDLGTEKRVAFLDMLLKVKHSDGKLTYDDIQEEVDTFMFEGHDTTSCASAWAFHCIGSHPDVQEKIHEEMDSIYGYSDRHVTNDDLSKMKYLECVIKESLRLFPSVPFHGRICTEDTITNGHKLYKGVDLVIFSYMIHRDEKYYPDPEKFDPTRFFPENSKDRHPFAYIPFSAGKRNCVGQRFAMMEMKVMLSSIMRKFHIKSLNTTEELKPSANIILKPDEGVPITISKRTIT